MKINKNLGNQDCGNFNNIIKKNVLLKFFAGNSKIKIKSVILKSH